MRGATKKEKTKEKSCSVSLSMVEHSSPLLPALPELKLSEESLGPLAQLLPLPLPLPLLVPLSLLLSLSLPLPLSLLLCFELAVASPAAVNHVACAAEGYGWGCCGASGCGPWQQANGHERMDRGRSSKRRWV